MLILFDIDHTLLNTNGAGRDALIEAGRAAFGNGFHSDGVEYAGRLDPLILRDLIRLNRVMEPDGYGRLRREYASRLASSMAGRAELFPGVAELLDAVEGAPGVTMGLLTGNFEETGLMKLAAVGIAADRFEVRVWGDDSPHEPPSRDHLPAVAMERHGRALGVPTPAERVVIVGDTPYDVACGRAHGCRVLGVATGVYPAVALGGADRVVEDLTATESITSWLLG